MKKYKFKNVLLISQVSLLIIILVIANIIGWSIFAKEFSSRQDEYIKTGIENIEYQNKTNIELATRSSEINSINTDVIEYLKNISNGETDEDKLKNLYEKMKKQVNQNYNIIIKSTPYIADIEVIDLNGLVLYRTESSNIGDYKIDGLTRLAMTGVESGGLAKSTDVNKIVLEGIYPVFSQGNVIGLIKTEIYLDNTFFNSIKEKYKFDIGIIYSEDIMYFSNSSSNLGNLLVKNEAGKSILSKEIYDDVISKDIMYVEKSSFWGDDNYLTILKSLKSYDKEFLGICIISYDLQVEKIENMNTIKKMSILMLLVAILAIIIGHYITSYTSKSIVELKDEIRKVDENSENIEIELETRIEEVHDLLSEFNNMIRRIIGQETKSKHLETEVNKDGLTGFWNHKYFYENVGNHLSNGIQFSLLFLDIDKFKKINDKLGHKVGDKVLEKLSESLKKIYPDFEYFRYGGEEFAVIMIETSVVNAYKFAENIRLYIENSEEIKKITRGLDVTISIGIASSDIETKSIDEIVSKADKAMYFGKYNGRNQSNIYDNEVEIFFETKESDIIKRESIHTAVESLISTLEEKDYYSGSHSKFVEKFSVMLGERIGMSLNSLDNLKMAASLHDIGKIGVPDIILKSNSQLNESEYEIAKEHPIIGYNISKHLFEDEEILKGIRNHHERWDGEGYPDGIKKEKIPLFARIISIADSYHSMVYGSHYRVKKSKEEAINELIQNSGKQFDPSLVDIFIDIVNDNYNGNEFEDKLKDKIEKTENESTSAPLGNYDIYDSTHYVMEIDKDRNIIFVNKAIGDMLGVDPDSLVGQKCYSTIFGNQNICSNCKISEVIYEKSVKESTRMERRKNRDLVTINQVFMPLFDAYGNVDHIMEFAYDKDMKEARNYKKRLKRRAKIKG